MSVSYDDLKLSLGNIVDPELKISLLESNGIKQLTISNDNVVDVQIALKNLKKHEDIIKLEVIKLVKIKLGFPGIKISFVESTYLAPGKKEIKYLAIASGKGGVGKSTVTANLAVALSRLGLNVGIIDADIYGASIPAVMNIKSEPLKTNEDEKMIPLKKDNIEVISTEFFMPQDKPLMWRGPLLGKMLSHYFGGVAWSENTDVILIDLPPGTGDVAIDVKELVPKSKIIVVTTPHENASMVAVKAGFGAIQIGHEVIGVIENMSYYFNNANQKREFIFGSGGGQIVADKLNVKLLGQIPIGQGTNKDSHLYDTNDIQAKMFDMIAKEINQLL